MKKRTTMGMGVLVLVLGGGFAALRLADRRSAESPAVAKQAANEPAPLAPRPAPALPERPRPPAREADSGVIDGRVIDGMTHEGVANAELTLVGDGGVSTFRTSSDGTFELTPTATGSYVLASITAAAYLPYAAPVGVSAARVTLTRGQAVHGVTLLLYPATDYEGTVVDARGAPVGGVTVRLLGAPGEPAVEALPEWKSGSGGHFTFQAADGAVLEASRGALRGWAHIDRSVLIMKKLTIRLGHAPPRDATITGRVRDAAGAPLAEAMVRAVPSEYYSTSPTVVATTGPDGRFTLAGVDRAQYDVTAEAANHLQAVRPSVPGGSRDVELALDTGQSITGQVVDKRGQPVPAFTLTVHRIDGLARAHVTTLSLIDPQGHFAVRVARGDYDLIASAPDHVRTTVQAGAGADGVRIVLDSGAILRGRVTAEDGSPIADAFVGVQTVRGGPRTPTAVPITTTRGDGTFELVGLGPGALALEVFSSGYARKLEELPAAGPDGARAPVAIALTPGGPTFDRPRAENTAGIGVQLSPQGDVLRIVSVMRDSGAQAAGLAVGDLIVAVDDVPVATLGTNTAIDRIRGLAGTSVTLTLRRAGHDARRSVERRQLRS